MTRREAVTFTTRRQESYTQAVLLCNDATLKLTKRHGCDFYKPKQKHVVTGVLHDFLCAYQNFSLHLHLKEALLSDPESGDQSQIIPTGYSHGNVWTACFLTPCVFCFVFVQMLALIDASMYRFALLKSWLKSGPSLKRGLVPPACIHSASLQWERFSTENTNSPERSTVARFNNHRWDTSEYKVFVHCTSAAVSALYTVWTRSAGALHVTSSSSFPALTLSALYDLLFFFFLCFVLFFYNSESSKTHRQNKDAKKSRKHSFSF